MSEHFFNSQELRDTLQKKNQDGTAFLSAYYLHCLRTIRLVFPRGVVYFLRMLRRSRLVDLVHAFKGVVAEQFKNRLEKLLRNSIPLW